MNDGMTVAPVVAILAPLVAVPLGVITLYLRSIRDQHRMVTHADYGTLMEQHPLVLRALARCDWGGSWPLVTSASSR